MNYTRPEMNSAHGVQLGGPAHAHHTTDSGEPAELQSTTDMDPVQRAALDRVYGWLFAPLQDGEQEGQKAA